jgi:hypothetical protein
MKIIEALGADREKRLNAQELAAQTGVDELLLSTFELVLSAIKSYVDAQPE